jgi:hypothetical protein
MRFDSVLKKIAGTCVGDFFLPCKHQVEAHLPHFVELSYQKNIQRNSSILPVLGR